MTIVNSVPSINNMTIVNTVPPINNMTIVNTVPPRITDDVTEVIGTINEQATLPCEYGGFPDPTISWMKNGESFPLTSLRHQMAYGAIQFSRVRLEDGGRYQCVVTNTVGNDTKVVDFAIQGKYEHI